jgi:uncharacterized protein (TIGR02996 family)
MNYEEAFLQSILEAPDDDLPRQAYADWLLDQGDQRGEFIHIQCRLARETSESVRRQLEARERELLAAHEEEWLGTLRPLLARWTFRRGFLDAVAVSAAAYIAHEAIAWPATVRHVEVDLTGYTVPQEIIELVPESVARENVSIPIGSRSRVLVMAMLLPLDASLRQQLEFTLNRHIEPIGASAEQVIEALNRHYGNSEVESVDTGVLLEYTEPPFEYEADSVPVMRLVDLIFFEAAALGADQIHLRPEEAAVRITYRIGGELLERDTLSLRLFESVVARIRAISALGPADDDGYQMGRVHGNLHGMLSDLDIIFRQDGDGVHISLAPA